MNFCTWKLQAEKADNIDVSKMLMTVVDKTVYTAKHDRNLIEGAREAVVNSILFVTQSMSKNNLLEKDREEHKNIWTSIIFREFF